MHSSVSSQPTGRVPTRPTSVRKPPTASNTSRRRDMLAPIRFRTGLVVVGSPRYVQPTTQSNSAGMNRGRAPGQSGSIEPPTPITAGSR